jgi:hypothetical protein
MMKSAALCDADGVQSIGLDSTDRPGRIRRILYGGRLHMFIHRSLTLLIARSSWLTWHLVIV